MMNIVNQIVETRKGLWIILSASAVLRALIASNSSMAVNHDGLIYIAAAQAFETGNFALASKTYPLPFYSILISFVHSLGMGWVTAGRLISAFSLVLVLVPLYLIAKDFFDRPTAFWSCLAFSFSPEPLRLTQLLLRDSPNTLLFVTSIYFAQHALKSRNYWNLVAAIICGMSMLIFRPEAMMLFFILLLALTLLAFFRSGPDQGVRTYRWIWVLSTVSVITIAWVLLTLYFRNAYLFNYLQDLAELKFFDNYYRIQSQLGKMEVSSPYGIASENFASIAQGSIPIIYMIGMLKGLIEIASPVNMIAICLGLFINHRFTPERSLVLASAAAYMIFIFAFTIYKDFFDNRFLLPSAVLMFPWAGLGIHRCVEFSGLHFKKIFAVICAVLLVVIFPLSKSNHRLKRNSDDLIISSGLWLAGHPEIPRDKVLSTDETILFYACNEGFCIQNQEGCRHFFSIDYDCLNAMAIDRGIQLIITYDEKSANNKHQINGYSKIKEIAGKIKSVVFHLEKNAAAQLQLPR